MNLDPQTPDLQDALIAWQGGELPPSRTDVLLQRIHADAAFRRALAEQVWTLSLTRVAQAPDPRWLALQEEIGLHETGARRSRAETGLAMEDRLMGRVRAEPLRFVAAWWRWVAAGAMAALVVVSSVLLLKDGSAPAPPASAKLAVLVPGEGMVWKHGGISARPSRLVGPGPLQLAAGKARLLFTNGVILDCEGPADLQLVSVDRVICHEGRLRTNVPPGAEGFCVETPQGAVTDLGTELGIAVSRAGKTSVAVFEGQAEVAVQMSGQSGVRTALLNKSDQAEFEAASDEIRGSSQDAPADVLPPPLPALRLPADYPQRVLAGRPVHYWRLDRLLGESIPNEVAGGPVLHLAGGALLPPKPPGGGQAGVQFHGRREPGILYASEPWQTPELGHAVEFWFVADTLEQMALAALTTTAADRPHVGLVEAGGRRAGQEFSAGSVRYLLRWPPGHRDGMNLYSPPVALPYQWHHVVAQHQAGRLHLFVDGEDIGTTQADQAPQSVECLLQFGALEHRPDHDLSKLRRPFSGRLAEIAVYDRVLTSDEIRAHASAAGSR